MKFKNFLQAVTIAAILAVYFFNAETIIAAVKEGMFVCYNTVIPSLFVFMVISSVLSCYKGSELISIPFVPFFRLFKITNKKLMTYCILSALGGFATGGQFLNKIGKEFDCDKNLNNILITLMANNSPAFVIVTVGLQMLGSIKSGILLYCSMIASCYITAFIMSFIIPYNEHQPIKNEFCSNSNISDSIKYAVTGILNICGAVIIANCICKVLQLYINFSVISVAFSIVCEVTSACNIICYEIGKNLYILCTAVTVFPLSAYFQMKSFDTDRIYNFKVMFVAKMFQLPIALCILRILANIFPVTNDVYASGDIKIHMYWNAPHISACLLITAICFVVLFDKKQRYLLNYSNKI